MGSSLPYNRQAAAALAELQAKAFGAGVVHLVAGAPLIVLDARGMARLTILPEAGGTVTVSLVDSLDAAVHSEAYEEHTDPTTIDVVWPFLAVSTATEDARLALLFWPASLPPLPED